MHFSNKNLDLSNIIKRIKKGKQLKRIREELIFFKRVKTKDRKKDKI